MTSCIPLWMFLWTNYFPLQDECLVTRKRVTYWLSFSGVIAIFCKAISIYKKVNVCVFKINSLTP
jgi:hypothetical protein